MEFLPDPLNDRTCKDLPPFVNKAVSDDVLFPKKDDGSVVVDWKLLEDFMSKEGPLEKRQVLKIIEQGV